MMRETARQGRQVERIITSPKTIRLTDATKSMVCAYLLMQTGM